MNEYNQISKIISRRESIGFAVETLTSNRHDASIARLGYVREVYNYLREKGNAFDQEMANYLETSDIKNWEAFNMAQVGKKTPADLKVAYLSGPNPVNDVEELIRFGVLPENVYAFENEKSIYDAAIMNALKSKFPYIKIFKGKIENYFQILPNRYDIIYLDFTGTLTSSNTLSVIKDLFRYNKLNSPGVLITNFSLPEPEEKEDKEGNEDKFWNSLISFCANYLYPKSFTEELSDYGGGAIESVLTQGMMPDEFLELAFNDPETFYSQTITRLLFDIPSLIVPYQKFASNRNLVDAFFKNFDVSQLPEEREEDFAFVDDHALVCSFSDFLYDDAGLTDLISKVSRQLAFDGNEKRFQDVLNLMDFFLPSHPDSKYNSDKIEKMQNAWKFEHKYIFCDVFLFHHVKELLVAQLTAPYFYNVAKTKRWTYKAKTNRMFVDAITYDECRYILEWMPTIDMVEPAVNSMDRQLTLRFALDSIAKQRRWYNEEFFMGTAVVDQRTPGFKAKELDKRIVIN